MVEIIANSICNSMRIATVLVKFPRMIEAQVLRHRAFSFSAESSRAKNLEKHIQDVRNENVSVIWTIDQKGMGGQLADKEISYAADVIAQVAKNQAINSVVNLKKLGIHKQNASRYLQPFESQTMIITATDWDNFFNLRCPIYKVGNETFRSHKSALNAELGKEIIKIDVAQPEIQELAEAIYDALEENRPNILLPGQWHIPYHEEYEDLPIEDQIKCSAARCARISFGGKGTVESNKQLYDKLWSEEHVSPFEHVCRAMSFNETLNYKVQEGSSVQHGRCRNLTGFISLRVLKENGYN